MCGIVGFISYGESNFDRNEILKKMCASLVHRGPDAGGEWLDPKLGVGFAHRRLSILDLSTQGQQPMASISGRYVIVYNGEIYNFESLRAELDLHDKENNQSSENKWRGHSDTEVILEAIERWGLEKAVKKFIGMFAFALWDKKEENLSLVRDRLGIKPLYYGTQGKTFLFTSELKAFKEHPEFQDEIDRNVLSQYLRYGYVPFPHSIYKGIYKLEPGHILTISRRSPESDYFSKPYWSLNEVVEQSIANPFVGSEEEAISELDALLRDSVKLRMVSDVPLGAFLSGGIDSSLVVALMQDQSKRPIQTFSIGFSEDKYNEAIYAGQIAKYLGTDHTELYLDWKQTMSVIPKLPTMYDEPFSDPSQIPTYIVSELARRKVTVSLSGDGGDELFGGYDRYAGGELFWGKIRKIPYPLRKMVAGLLGPMSNQYGEYPANSRKFNFLLNGNLSNVKNKVNVLSKFLKAENFQNFYKEYFSQWREPEGMVIGASEPKGFSDLTQVKLDKIPDVVQQMMFMDTVSYLPEDILTKVDRASMGVSLEARVPLLDHRVVEFAWQLPMKYKVKGDKKKWVLRKLLGNYLPNELFERPKMGFGVPVGQWIKGPLREWAEDLLDEKKLREEGYFRSAPIKSAWKMHLSGERNETYRLWSVLMFQAWLRN
jgi:asparagine synthase (glutamine-hydrolysing)